MTSIRRSCGLLLTTGTILAMLGSPASAGTGVGRDGPHVEPGPGGVVCGSDVPETEALPQTGACVPMPMPSTITYGCEMVGAVTTSGDEVGTVSGFATSTDARVYWAEITCTIIQDATATDVHYASAGTFARTVNVSSSYTLPAAQYHVCASGLFRYVENNVVQVVYFGDAAC